MLLDPTCGSFESLLKFLQREWRLNWRLELWIFSHILSATVGAFSLGRTPSPNSKMASAQQPTATFHPGLQLILSAFSYNWAINQGEKSINFFFIMVPLRKSIKVWYSKAQIRKSTVEILGGLGSRFLAS